MRRFLRGFPCRVAAVLCAVVLSVTTVPLAAQQTDAQIKADQARAKQIAKEGEALYKKKQWADSRSRFVDAMRLDNSPKYGAYVGAIDAQIDRLIRKSLGEAESLHSKKQYPQALAKLDETKAWRAVDPTVSYNRAIVLHDQGRVSEALKEIEQAASQLSGDERMRLLQLQTQWQTGEAVKAPTAEREESAKALNEALASGEGLADVCAQVRALAGGSTKTPSLLFNLAKCAEADGHLDEAAKYLDEYLAAAPNATDGDTIKAGVDEFQALAKRAGAAVIALYGEADSAAKQGHYKAATDILLKAATAAPSLPETQLKLARLYQASADAPAAKAAYDRYLTLKKDPMLAGAAKQEADALTQRSLQYETIMGPARERFETWLHRNVITGRPMGSAAAANELSQIAQLLQQAVVMMPLGAERRPRAQ